MKHSNSPIALFFSNKPSKETIKRPNMNPSAELHLNAEPKLHSHWGAQVDLPVPTEPDETAEEVMISGEGSFKKFHGKQTTFRFGNPEPEI